MGLCRTWILIATTKVPAAVFQFSTRQSCSLDANWRSANGLPRFCPGVGLNMKPSVNGSPPKLHHCVYTIVDIITNPDPICGGVLEYTSRFHHKCHNSETRQAQTLPWDRRGCARLSHHFHLPSQWTSGDLNKIESTEVLTWSENYLTLTCSIVQCPPTITSTVRVQDAVRDTRPARR